MLKTYKTDDVQWFLTFHSKIFLDFIRIATKLLVFSLLLMDRQVFSEFWFYARVMMNSFSNSRSYKKRIYIHARIQPIVVVDKLKTGVDFVMTLVFSRITWLRLIWITPTVSLNKTNFMLCWLFRLKKLSLWTLCEFGFHQADEHVILSKMTFIAVTGVRLALSDDNFLAKL